MCIACSKPVDREKLASGEYDVRGAGNPCIIATACLGEESERVQKLRHLRDEAIMTDPVVRDFVHMFWSRSYDEWSLAVARLAAQDPNVGRHIRWAFLDPWLAWLEFVVALGRREVAELDEREREALLVRLRSNVERWLLELPAQMESKRPDDPERVYQSFDAFRERAMAVFGEERGKPADATARKNAQP